MNFEKKGSFDHLNLQTDNVKCQIIHLNWNYIMAQGKKKTNYKCIAL